MGKSVGVSVGSGVGRSVVVGLGAGVGRSVAVGLGAGAGVAVGSDVGMGVSPGVGMTVGAGVSLEMGAKVEIAMGVSVLPGWAVSSVVVRPCWQPVTSTVPTRSSATTTKLKKDMKEEQALSLRRALEGGLYDGTSLEGDCAMPDYSMTIPLETAGERPWLHCRR